LELAAQSMPDKRGSASGPAPKERAGPASSTEVDERYVQKQLGHAGAEMTRRGRGRDRFRLNLTEAAGLWSADSD
jgi:hypothetical protein